MVTPFLPSLAWVRVYANRLLSGSDDIAARLEADRATETKGKMFAHGKLATETLTVPAEGGSAKLKILRPEVDGYEPLLSDHGKWRREHLGAFQAIYGKTPYYIHLMPSIEQAYKDSEGISLEKFNSRLLEIAMNWIDFEALGKEAQEDSGTPFAEAGREISERLDPQLSIFDAIFRLGVETTCGIAFHPER